MRIVAYYHEETDGNGVTRKSVGLERRDTVVDEPLVLERDALAEIERLESMVNRSIQANYELRAELAALKAQEPVARLPACPSRVFAVANLRDLAQSVLQHDPDVGIFRDEDQAYLINELADLAEAFNGDVKLYAAPVSEAKAQGVVLTDEELCSIRNQVACNEVRLDDDSRTICVKHGRALEAAVLARITAAPAAPAADAGLVEALELAANRLDRLALEQGEFWRGYATAWADEARAAHRAKGGWCDGRRRDSRKDSRVQVRAMQATVYCSRGRPKAWVGTLLF